MSNFMIITEGSELSIKAKAAKKQLKAAIKEIKAAGVQKKQAIQLMANLVPVELEEYDQDVVVKDGKIIIDFDDVSKKDLKKAIKAAKKQILEGLLPSNSSEDETESEKEESYFEPQAPKMPSKDEEELVYCENCDENVRVDQDGDCVQCGSNILDLSDEDDNDDDRHSL